MTRVSLFWVFVKSAPTRIFSRQAGHAFFFLKCGSDLLEMGQLAGLYSGVARICCEEGQKWKLCYGALTVDFRAGCMQQLLND